MIAVELQILVFCAPREHPSVDADVAAVRARYGQRRPMRAVASIRSVSVPSARFSPTRAADRLELRPPLGWHHCWRHRRIEVAGDVGQIDLVLLAVFDQLHAAEAVSSHPDAALVHGFSIGAARPGQRASYPFCEVGAKVPRPARLPEPHRRAQSPVPPPGPRDSSTARAGHARRPSREAPQQVPQAPGDQMRRTSVAALTHDFRRCVPICEGLNRFAHSSGACPARRVPPLHARTFQLAALRPRTDRSSQDRARFRTRPVTNPCPARMSRTRRPEQARPQSHLQGGRHGPAHLDQLSRRRDAASGLPRSSGRRPDGPPRARCRSPAAQPSPGPRRGSRPRQTSYGEDRQCASS
jgi:hypothetical protein